MTENIDIRPLAPSERYFAHVEYFAGYVVRLSGQLDLDVLAKAYRALLHNYPILGARIEVTASGYSFATSGTLPEVSVIDGDPERLAGETTLDQSTSLSGLAVVRGKETASTTLFVHHSIADGQHGLAVFDELWSYYTEITAGRQVAEQVRAYPLPVEDLLIARGVKKLALPTFADAPTPEATSLSSPAGVSTDTAAIPALNLLARQPDPLLGDDFTGLGTTRIRLSKEQTAALTTLCHDEQVTINGVIGGAILLAHAETRGMRLTELLYCYPVDLRTKVAPPIDVTEGTNVIGSGFYQPTEYNAGVLELAREICATLDAGLAAGIVQQGPLQFAEIPGGSDNFLMPPGMVFGTNVGRVPPMRTPLGLQITDFYITHISNADRVKKRRLEALGDGAVVFHTYDDQLSIEAADSPAIVSRIAGTLHAVIRISESKWGRADELPSAVALHY
ncbi:hypothetical protein ACFTS5_33415 [Nocardia sp. NPDC056952]|uniref:phthiocerol/phthiodiolone dimycocerosyl transferase family protein n=1 Tax=Nocardia sp. NPDC056952 TaxID=3345979 RepID=UPI00364085EE